MTYTTEQLQGMSDFEVNKAVALNIYPDATVVRSYPDSDSITIYAKQFTKIMVDYCNNPNDIMPLAFERKITIGPLMRTCGKTWIASFSYGLSCEDTNPLRAIACLVLMM